MCGPWCGLSEHRGSRLNPILRPILVCLLFSVPCDNFTKQVIFRGIIVFRGVGSLILGFVIGSGSTSIRTHSHIFDLFRDWEMIAFAWEKGP